MAKTVTNPRIGQLVYPSYTPQKVGVITKLEKFTARGGYEDWKVTVETLKGTIKYDSCMSLKDFNALVADHRKKIETIEGYVDKLEKGS
jgi:hypothetical protein